MKNDQECTMDRHTAYRKYVLIIMLFICNTTLDYGQAFEIDSSGGNGMSIKRTKYKGLSIEDSGSDGISVLRSTFDGIIVGSSGGNGILVTASDGYGIHVEGNKSEGTLAGHIGLIYNYNTGTNADVLALKIGNSGNLSTFNNYITFYRGDNGIAGQIEGNGNDGVQYMSAGSDYAEYLPVLDKEDTFRPGDIVGVFQGHITLKTMDADRLMVITRQAAVVGNMPKQGVSQEMSKGFEIVSFVGQVLTRVQGPVKAGDWIVASGKNNGVGVAIAPADVTFDHQIVGQAWETSEETGVHHILVSVGLDKFEAFKNVIRNQQIQIDELKEMIQKLLGKTS